MKVKAMMVLVASVIAYADPVFSTVIVPQNVTLLSGTYSDNTPLLKMIDGSGLSNQSLSADLTVATHNSTDANEARLFTSPSASIRLDLNGSYNIEKAFYWNTNTAAFNDVSTIKYSFLSSDSLTIFNSGNITTPGPLGLIEMPSNIYTPGLLENVSYVDVTFTRRAGGNSFAPGEIRFTGVVSNVPVPASVWLLSSSVLGLVSFSKRKA